MPFKVAELEATLEAESVTILRLVENEKELLELDLEDEAPAELLEVVVESEDLHSHSFT